MFITPQQP